MRLKAVVLPAPFGPINPTRSCSPTTRFSAETAVNPPKRMVQFSSCNRFCEAVTKLFALLSATDLGSPAKREQPLRAQHHQKNDQQRIDDHAIVGKPAKKF